MSDPIIPAMPYTRAHHNRRSVDVFEALHDLRAQQEAGIGTSDSNLPLMSSQEWPVSIPASSLGTFQLPGVPGEWRASGTVTPTSHASRTYAASMVTLPTAQFRDSSIPSKSDSFQPESDNGHPLESDVESATPPPPDEVFFSQIHEYAFIFNVCIAQLFSLASLAQTVAPLPIIANYFNNHDPGQLSWFTAAYSLTVGTFILPAGRLGDMYGHKRIFMFGWLWFSVWSIICGFSKTTIQLSAFRAMQGIGPALLVPNAMALVGRTFPMGMKRNLVFSLFGACGPTGWVVGAFFSSLCAQLGGNKLKPSGWAWSFWFLAMATFFASILSSFVIPSPSTPPPAMTHPTDKNMVRLSRPALAQPKAQFDYLGCCTGVSGLILVNFAINQAPLVGWKTPYIYYILILGALIITFFIYVELKIASHPLVPLRGLSREAGFVLGCITAGWGSHGIWIYYFYLFLEDLRGSTALSAVAQTVPVVVTGTIAALSVGFLLKKFKVGYVMMAAMLCFLVGAVLLATAPVEQSYWTQIFLSVLIMPGGMNLSFPAGTIILSNALPREHQGIAASLISTMVNYSISTGLGIAGTIAVNTDKHGQDPLAGFRGAWYFGIGLSALGVVIAGWFVLKTRP